MGIGLVILLYFVIGAIVEFLMVFGVLMYAKRHSNSDEQFIEVWNKASDIIILSSINSTNNINNSIADIFKIQIFTHMFIWPLHISIIIVFNICMCWFYLTDRFFNKLTSVLIKR